MAINYTLEKYQIWQNYGKEQERCRGGVRYEMTVAQPKVMEVKMEKRRWKEIYGNNQQNSVKD